MAFSTQDQHPALHGSPTCPTYHDPDAPCREHLSRAELVACPKSWETERDHHSSSPKICVVGPPAQDAPLQLVPCMHLNWGLGLPRVPKFETHKFPHATGHDYHTASPACCTSLGRSLGTMTEPRSHARARVFRGTLEPGFQPGPGTVIRITSYTSSTDEA